MNFKIGSDSACDLSAEEIKESGLVIVPFYVSFDGVKYQKEREEIAVSTVYETMINDSSIFPKTSMPSTADYMSVFTEIIKKGEALLFFCLSSKLSGSYQSAMLARTMILEEDPEAKLYVVDSLCASALQGVLVSEILRMQKDGFSYEECIDKAEKMKSTGCVHFSAQNLEYLQKGGRVGKALKMAAMTLKIKPLIALKDGEIIPEGITRSRKKALESLLQTGEKIIQSKDPNQYRLAVGYGYDEEEGLEFFETFKKLAEENGYKGEIKLYQIGVTIGVHTGPHPIGIGYISRYENIES